MRLGTQEGEESTERRAPRRRSRPRRPSQRTDQWMDRPDWRPLPRLIVQASWRLEGSQQPGCQARRNYLPLFQPGCRASHHLSCGRATECPKGQVGIRHTQTRHTHPHLVPSLCFAWAFCVGRRARCTCLGSWDLVHRRDWHMHGYVQYPTQLTRARPDYARRGLG